MAGNEKIQESYDKMKQDCAQWLNSVMKLLPAGVSDPKAMPITGLSNQRALTRDGMGQKLVEIMRIVCTQTDYVAHLEGELQQLKSDVIDKQERVIKLQQELITAKEGQLADIRDTVVSSVSDTVKTQFQSYSDAVKGAGNQTGSSLLDQNTLKTVVKNVVEEEDRSKNFLIFGLPEDPKEQISSKVNEVLEELGEKPKVEAVRIGLKAKKQTPRPVKVSVSNTIVVTKILSRARKLRDSQRFKMVFISPDRTPDQRAAHRELVERLKLKKTEEPQMRHYIRGGQICSFEKT